MLGLSLVKSLMTRLGHVGMRFLHKMPPRQVQERFMEDIQPLFDALAETNHSQRMQTPSIQRGHLEKLFKPTSRHV